MDGSAIFALFMVIALWAIKPGPGMMATMSRTLSGGLKSAIFFLLGNYVIEVAYFGIVIAGFAITDNSLQFFSVIGRLGAGAYLCWLGITEVLKNLRQEQSYVVAPASSNTLTGNFRAGVIFGLSSPLEILFFAGILPTFIDVTHLGFHDFLIGSGVIIAADLGTSMIFLLPLALFRKFMSPARLRQVSLVSSGGMALIGLYMLYTVFAGTSF